MDIVQNFKYGYVIQVYDTKYPNGSVIHHLSWSGFTFEQFVKWLWYFEYRAALFRVQFPRNCITASQKKEPLDEKSKVELIKKQIASRKALITKYTNKYESFLSEFRSYTNSYSKIFPIEEEQEYQFYVRSLDLAESKIKKVEKELEELEQSIYQP